MTKTHDVVSVTPMKKRGVALSAALLACSMARAETLEGLRLESVQTTSVLGFETLRLPHGEHMGLVGGSLLFDVGAGWALGPAVYGAVTGDRGGFFVGGLALQHRWMPSPGWTLAADLYAGGGGGAAAPVGSGLMLRPALTLLKDVGPALQLGLSLSSVRFPSGEIASEQFGLVMAWRSEYLYFDGPHGALGSASARKTGLGFDRISLSTMTYRFDSESRPVIGLVGARAERRSAKAVRWGMEAAAAARGDAAGYMEILATVGLSAAPLPEVLPSWRVGMRLAGGLGGGGAVPTGGGLIGKASATMEWSPAPGWTLGGEIGQLRSAKAGLDARQAQLWLGLDLEPAPDAATVASRVVRTEWVGGIQHHLKIKRSDGSHRALDTIGLKLNRYVDEHIYLSGQAHSAYAGQAGAYSVGLVGAGVASSVPSRLRIGAELLAGAAGGGGVSTEGGAIVQAVLWTGWNPSPQSEWRVGIGTMQTLGDRRGTPLAEVAWSRAFGMSGR